MEMFVASFTGSRPMNVVEDGKTYVGFRREEFLPREVGSQKDNVTFPFRVTRVEYLGADRLIYGVLEGRTPEARVISKLPNNIRAEITPGQKYDFVVGKSDIVRFDGSTARRPTGRGRRYHNPRPRPT